MVAAISQDLEEFMQSEVANGRFASREEVITAGLTLLRDRRAEFAQRVRDALAAGDATPGDNVVIHNEAELDAFFEDIKSRGRERLAKRQAMS